VRHYTSHPTAQFIRNEVREGFSKVISKLAPDFLVEASPGKGGWTDTPWVAILDPLVTDTPQEGIYIAYLFSSSMERLYISLNQGITQFQINTESPSGEVN